MHLSLSFSRFFQDPQCCNKRLLLVFMLLTRPRSSFLELQTDGQVLSCSGNMKDELPPNLEEFDPMEHNVDNMTIPERFDAREKWPDCKSISTIQYQGQCGGCWAFSTTTAMSDRLCIATNGKFNEMLSIQDMLECCTQCVDKEPKDKGGCAGGFNGQAHRFWMHEGLVTEKCKPLYEGITKNMPYKTCRKKCMKAYKISYKKDKRYSTGFVLYPGGDLRIVQAEIMLYGPIAAAAKIYAYVHDYKPGTILQDDPEKKQKDERFKGHGFRFIGWDVIDEVPVWIVANTWGTSWGNKGFAYLRRGHNDFDVEAKSVFMAPRVVDGKKDPKRNGVGSRQKAVEGVVKMAVVVVWIAVADGHGFLLL